MITRCCARLAIAIIALVCVGCASSSGTKLQSTSSEGNVVTTYDDPTYGVRLTYPGNWEEQSMPFRPKGTIIVLTAPSDVGGMRMPPTLAVVAQDSQPQSTDSATTEERLDAMQKRMIEKFSKEFSDFKLVDSGPATLGGEPARRIIYTASKLTVKIETMTVVALHGGRGYS